MATLVGRIIRFLELVIVANALLANVGFAINAIKTQVSIVVNCSAPEAMVKLMNALVTVEEEFKKLIAVNLKVVEFILYISLLKVH